MIRRLLRFFKRTFRTEHKHIDLCNMSLLHRNPNQCDCEQMRELLEELRR